MAKRIVSSQWFGLFCVAVMAWAGYQLYGVLNRAYELRGELYAAEEKKAALEKRDSVLTQSLRQLQSPEFLEREAKERLNLKNPGEEVAVIVPEQTQPAGTTTQRNLWDRIKNLFPFLR